MASNFEYTYKGTLYHVECENFPFTICYDFYNNYHDCCFSVIFNFNERTIYDSRAKAPHHFPDSEWSSLTNMAIERQLDYAMELREGGRRGN